jgi:hypothetical protein
VILLLKKCYGIDFNDRELFNVYAYAVYARSF